MRLENRESHVSSFHRKTEKNLKPRFSRSNSFKILLRKCTIDNMNALDFPIDSFFDNILI